MTTPSSWKPAKPAKSHSEKNGPLARQVISWIMRPTDYSSVK